MYVFEYFSVPLSRQLQTFQTTTDSYSRQRVLQKDANHHSLYQLIVQNKCIFLGEINRSESQLPVFTLQGPSSIPGPTDWESHHRLSWSKEGSVPQALLLLCSRKIHQKCFPAPPLLHCNDPANIPGNYEIQQCCAVT